MIRRRRTTGILQFGVISLIVLHAGRTWAQEAAKIDTGDTAWMLTSAALVLMMTAPGLALFYGGLVRSKNGMRLFSEKLDGGRLWPSSFALAPTNIIGRERDGAARAVSIIDGILRH